MWGTNLWKCIGKYFRDAYLKTLALAEV